MLGGTEKKVECLWASMGNKGKMNFAYKVTKEYIKLILREKGINTVAGFKAECAKPHNIFSKDRAGLPQVCYYNGPHTNNLDEYVDGIAKLIVKNQFGSILYLSEIGQYWGEAFEDFFVSKLLDVAEKQYKKNIELIEELNSIIKTRNTYGARTEYIKKVPSCLMVWSNSAEMWRAADWTIDKPRKMELDANMVVIPYLCDVVRKVQCFLAPLPLYAYSFEFKKRYVSPESWLEHSKMWAEKRFEDMLERMLRGEKSV